MNDSFSDWKSYKNGLFLYGYLNGTDYNWKLNLSFYVVSLCKYVMNINKLLNYNIYTVISKL